MLNILKRFKYSFFAIVLAFSFGLFFQITKHASIFGKVMVFGNDPYDAVGSFGSLLAGFASLISLFWTIRSKRDNQLMSSFLVIFSFGVTLFIDYIALIRYIHVWVGQYAGWLLALFTLCLSLITILVGWLVFKSGKMILQKKYLKRALILTFLFAITFLIYPTNIIKSVAGELVTLFIGMMTFFILVKEWESAFFPHIKIAFKQKLNRLVWVIFIGILLGIGLLKLETMSEGISSKPGIPLMLILIFAGAMGTGSLLCYLLLSEYLGFSKV